MEQCPQRKRCEQLAQSYRQFFPAEYEKIRAMLDRPCRWDNCHANPTNEDKRQRRKKK